MLPDGPTPWSHVDLANRRLVALELAGNGDILVGGVEYEPVPDEPPKLWLARLAPTGSVVWSSTYASDLDDHDVSSIQLASTPGGDIVAVRPAHLRAVDAAGETLWLRAAPEGDAWSVDYRDVAVDAQGRIFIGGDRGHGDAASRAVYLEALAPDGALLWQTSLKSPAYGATSAPSLMVDPAGSVLVAMQLSDSPDETGGGAVAAYDAAGALQWWRSSPGTTRAIPGAFVPAPNGGFFVDWDFMGDDSGSSSVARYDAEGARLYELDQVEGWVLDFRAGPDGRFYSLETSEWEDDEGRYVVPHLP
ncbi:hypothetical protein SAMN02745121_09176 [Nannocystis exedens]|uniref:PQQ-like domain-containing protein n=1 Tax=Nannocystis exedens TaxID=54 RepID=A0A1I2J6B1_9BACT|nr:PQQ-binding-like beta-propeller repeat protein [Nannocystis exedens]PCC68706.1 hypothetical protein NAEX_01723 [Nannocystis exedens]SFF49383.1 hypothetical protein SAMN02745121_09176 [Nannocystis exedens]